MLDLVTNNPSLVKTSTSIPGISDHTMIVTVIDSIPQYLLHKPHPKIYFLFKADKIKVSSESISEDIISMCLNSRATVHDIRDEFENGISRTVEKNIPSKIIEKAIGTMVQQEAKDNATMESMSLRTCQEKQPVEQLQLILEDMQD